MARRRVKADLKRVSLTIEKELVEWLDGMVRAEIFTSKSQGVSVALKHLKAYYEKEKRLPGDYL